MKNKSTIIGLSIMLVLAAGFLFSGRNGKNRTAGQNPVIVTQDGRLTIIPPESRAAVTFVADTPKPATNTASAITTRTNQ